MFYAAVTTAKPHKFFQPNTKILLLPNHNVEPLLQQLFTRFLDQGLKDSASFFHLSNIQMPAWKAPEW